LFLPVITFSCATTVILTEFRISMAKVAFNKKKNKKEEEAEKEGFAQANWIYI
jgi:hypothetical protein